MIERLRKSIETCERLHKHCGKEPRIRIELEDAKKLLQYMEDLKEASGAARAPAT